MVRTLFDSSYIGIDKFIQIRQAMERKEINNFGTPGWSRKSSALRVAYLHHLLNRKSQGQATVSNRKHQFGEKDRLWRSRSEKDDSPLIHRPRPRASHQNVQTVTGKGENRLNGLKYLFVFHLNLNRHDWEASPCAELNLSVQFLRLLYHLNKIDFALKQLDDQVIIYSFRKNLKQVFQLNSVTYWLNQGLRRCFQRLRQRDDPDEQATARITAPRAGRLVRSLLAKIPSHIRESTSSWSGGEKKEIQTNDSSKPLEPGVSVSAQTGKCFAELM